MVAYLGGDLLACWDSAGYSLPARKNASQAYRYELSFEIELDASPNDPEYASKDNDKILSVDSKTRAR